MSMERVFDRLIERIEALELIVRRQSTRMNNMFREGEVKEVDYEKGLAVVEAHGILSKPVPWLEQAGEVNEWTPLSVGQRVVLVSPDGDLGKGFIMKGGFTDDVKAPHNIGAEKKVVIDGATVTHSAKGFVFEVGGTKFEFTAEGLIQTGGKQMHDGKDVGSTHVHNGVASGGATTSTPL